MRRLVELGHKVFAICPSGVYSKQFEREGIQHIHYSISRIGMNPLGELGVVCRISYLLQNLSLDLLHSFTAKPNIYGCLASFFTPRQKNIASITGLGSMFLEPQSSAKSMIMRNMYRLALKRATRVVFQNQDDQQYFENNKVISKSKSCLIRGSGVCVEKFQPVERLAREVITVCMVSRLIWDKGIRELVEASRIMESFYSGKFRIVLVGSRDPGNPKSLSEKEVEDLSQNNNIQLLGHRDDVPKILEEADIYCLPSYREGLPFSVLEAMASALPIVTTNVPGCRETVVDGKNGFLVAPYSGKEIAAALGKLIDNPRMRDEMGKASRRMSEKLFSDKIVVSSFLQLYEDALKKPLS